MKKYKKSTNSSKMKKNTTTKIKRRRICKKFYINHCSFKKIPQIFSPPNTTQYLIENNSSPFYFDENEEDDFDLNLNLNPLLSLDSGNVICSTIVQDGLESKNLHSEYELASTAAQSQEFQNLNECIE
jgi:hypothetical protein